VCRPLRTSSTSPRYCVSPSYTQRRSVCCGSWKSRVTILAGRRRPFLLRRGRGRRAPHLLCLPCPRAEAQSEKERAEQNPWGGPESVHAISSLNLIHAQTQRADASAIGPLG